jgi:cytochrome oxidase Cu insertion factor (SCO1/SenC/PrrC family)
VSRARLALVAIVLAALAGCGFGLMAALAPGAERDQIPSHERDRFGLPKLHGQAKWSAGKRRAPPFALHDHDGRRVSLGSLRRRPVLLTFFDSECRDQCPVAGRQLGMMLSQMAPAERPTLVMVSVNPSGDTPESIRHAMVDWRLVGQWRWHWLRGTRADLAAVWRDYGITVDPTNNDVTHGMALYLIDKRGFQRTAYLFPFLPNFVERDLKILARERS